MEKNIALEYECLQQDITRFGEALERFTADANKIYKELDSLHGVWYGPAHDLYESQVENDREFVNSVIMALKLYKEVLMQSERIYRRREDAVQTIIDQL